MPSCLDGCVRISVIIPALNEAATIRRAALSAFNAGAGEVIVVDGGSRDETAAIADRCGCRVLQSPRGRAVQMNAGSRASSGNVLLFLHADGALAADCGRQIATALSRRRVTHGAFAQRIEAPGLTFRWLERGNALRVRWLGLPYGDQAIFVRRDAFERCGGFPRVPLLEDLLLMQRLRRRSWPVLLEGPVFVSPRRWHARGVLRQTLRNWAILSAFSCGVSPTTLARHYGRHDEQ
jgi:rSAM/selenodomain-associated transferase 2